MKTKKGSMIEATRVAVCLRGKDYSLHNTQEQTYLIHNSS